MLKEKVTKIELLEAIVEEEREKYTEEDYDDMLDECYDEISIGGITFNPSQVLKECDPTAYRCGFNDYQEYESVYKCPICGEEYNYDEDEAKFCCQNEDEQYICNICGEKYEFEEDAELCCEDENENEEESDS